MEYILCCVWWVLKKQNSCSIFVVIDGCVESSLLTWCYNYIKVFYHNLMMIWLVSCVFLMLYNASVLHFLYFLILFICFSFNKICWWRHGHYAALFLIFNPGKCLLDSLWSSFITSKIRSFINSCIFF